MSVDTNIDLTELPAWKQRLHTTLTIWAARLLGARITECPVPGQEGTASGADGRANEAPMKGRE